MMRLVYCLAALPLLVYSPLAASHPGLTINFVEPEKYTDVGLSGSSSPKTRRYVLTTLEHYLHQLADHRLPERHTLKIDFYDIDMAGEYEPWRAPMLNNTRFIRDIYRPQIKLHYQWRDAQGNVLAEGDETVSDPVYLQHADPGYLNNDPLRYEKTLLKRWFEKKMKINGRSAP